MYLIHSTLQDHTNIDHQKEAETFLVKNQRKVKNKSSRLSDNIHIFLSFNWDKFKLGGEDEHRNFFCTNIFVFNLFQRYFRGSISISEDYTL